MPEDLPDRMPEDMPEDMPEHMPEDMPDRMPDRMPEDMPDRMPEGMPDRMPDKMSDRMPEDLPVTKCINVMVGITRSKVILFHSFSVALRVAAIHVKISSLFSFFQFVAVGITASTSCGSGLPRWQNLSSSLRRWDTLLHLKPLQND